MKNIYITLSLILIIASSYGQDKSTQKADKLFDSYQYVSAIDEYLKLANDKNATPYVFSQLGDSYYNIFNINDAAKWYEKAVQIKTSLYPEVYYRYAQTLKSLRKYEEANKQMNTFASLSPNDSRAIEHKANPNYIPSLGAKSKLFETSETSLKSDGQTDFGAFLANDNTLYFASTRGTGNKNDKWNNQPYLDIYKSIRNSNGSLSEAVAVTELNTPFHDGPVTITSDGNTMYFARDGHSSKQYKKSETSNTRIGQQGLYKATKIDGKWTNIEPLPLNSRSYSSSNPSISADGKTLYFSSNMPGGSGESDIWKVAVNENGYGKPENLGSKINTKGKENFPFITDDNILYFSSTGKQGFGGFDVFKVNANSNDEPINIGNPVNSENDDFSFSFNKKENIGFFSSNRNGSDQIFSANPVAKAEAIAIVTNKTTGEPLKNAFVSILDSKGNAIDTKQTNAEGKVIYEVEKNKDYAFLVKADQFETATYPIKQIKTGETIIKATLEPVKVVITEKEILLNPIYFEFDKSNITSQGSEELNKLVTVLNQYPNLTILIKSHTDAKGSAEYNRNLSERRAQSTVQYLISKGISKERLSGKGYGYTEPKIDCKDNCTEEQNAQNRRSEFVIVKNN